VRFDYRLFGSPIYGGFNNHACVSLPFTRHIPFEDSPPLAQVGAKNYVILLPLTEFRGLDLNSVLRRCTRYRLQFQKNALSR